MSIFKEINVQEELHFPFAIVTSPKCIFLTYLVDQPRSNASDTHLKRKRLSLRSRLHGRVLRN
jgi:hypothetical protein